MSDETLKPCPFCGGRAEFLPTDPPTEVSVGCFSSECPLADVATEWNDKETVTAYWNTRADEDRIRAEAAAERTAAILEILRRHDLRDCSPGYLANTIEMAFPKPGGAK